MEKKNVILTVDLNVKDSIQMLKRPMTTKTSLYYSTQMKRRNPLSFESLCLSQLRPRERISKQELRATTTKENLHSQLTQQQFDACTLSSLSNVYALRPQQKFLEEKKLNIFIV